MPLPTFTAEGESVLWNPGGRSIRLRPCDVDCLLDLFAMHGAASLFNQLYEADREATGIARVSPFRERPAA